MWHASSPFQDARKSVLFAFRRLESVHAFFFGGSGLEILHVSLAGCHVELQVRRNCLELGATGSLHML
jgi:hypothetical protein